MTIERLSPVPCERCEKLYDAIALTTDAMMRHHDAEHGTVPVETGEFYRRQKLAAARKVLAVAEEVNDLEAIELMRERIAFFEKKPS